MFKIVFNHRDEALVRYGVCYLGIAYTVIFEEFLYVFLPSVRHLNDYSRVFSKQHLDNIVILLHNIMQVYVHASRGVGESHFEQCSDKATG